MKNLRLRTTSVRINVYSTTKYKHSNRVRTIKLQRNYKSPPKHLSAKLPISFVQLYFHPSLITKILPNNPPKKKKKFSLITKLPINLSIKNFISYLPSNQTRPNRENLVGERIKAWGGEGGDDRGESVKQGDHNPQLHLAPLWDQTARINPARQLPIVHQIPSCDHHHTHRCLVLHP